VLGDARPGRKVVLTGDTAPADETVEAAWRADLLVHEGTFCEDEADRAAETEHSTAHEAARVARDAEVRLLALTHLSSRYGAGQIEREARAVFPDTVVPRDFDLIDVPFPERGAPELVKSGARLPRAEVGSGA
jgi:ribonuclease Z